MTLAVVIPARDAETVLGDCIGAVLRQRAADEVLIVVAPSADATKDVAAALAGGVMRVLENSSGDRGSAI